MRKNPPLIRHDFLAYVARVGDHQPCVIPISPHSNEAELFKVGFIKMRIKAIEIREPGVKNVKPQ